MGFLALLATDFFFYTAALCTPIGTLCEATGSHRALSLFSSTACFDSVSSVCCNSECCDRSSFISHATSPYLGFESQSRSFFLMTTHINQSIKLYKKYSPLTDRCRGVGRRKKSEKLILTGIRTPDLETWNLKWNYNWHSMLNCSTRSKRSQSTL